MATKVRRATRKAASKVGKRLTGRRTTVKRASYKSGRSCSCGRR